MLDTRFISVLEQNGPMARAWRTGAIGVEYLSPGDRVILTDRVSIRYLMAPTIKRHGSGNLVDVRAGTGWLLPGDVKIKCAYEAPARGIGVTLSNAALEEVVPEGAGMPHIPAIELDDPVVQQMVVGLYEASLTDDAYSALYRDTMTLALAAHLCRAYGRVDPIAGERRDPRILRVLDYIEDNLAEPVSLDELASVAAMSRYHFAKTFKEQVTMPPHRYLAERRIERAKQLLASSKLPASEVAYRVGYGSQSNFTATFRRLTGVTPARYRQAVN